MGLSIGDSPLSSLGTASQGICLSFVRDAIQMIQMHKCRADLPFHGQGDSVGRAEGEQRTSEKGCVYSVLLSAQYCAIYDGFLRVLAVSGRGITARSSVEAADPRGWRSMLKEAAISDGVGAPVLPTC